MNYLDIKDISTVARVWVPEEHNDVYTTDKGFEVRYGLRPIKLLSGEEDELRIDLKPLNELTDSEARQIITAQAKAVEERDLSIGALRVTLARICADKVCRFYPPKDSEFRQGQIYIMPKDGELVFKYSDDPYREYDFPDKYFDFITVEEEKKNGKE